MCNKVGVFKEDASASFIPEQNLHTYYLYDQQTIGVVQNSKQLWQTSLRTS